MSESNQSVSSQKEPVTQKPTSHTDTTKSNLKKVQDTLKQITDNQKTIQNAMKVIHEKGIDFSKLDKKAQAQIKEKFLQSDHFNDKELKFLNFLIDVGLKTPSGKELGTAYNENQLEKLDQKSQGVSFGAPSIL